MGTKVSNFFTVVIRHREPEPLRFYEYSSIRKATTFVESLTGCSDLAIRNLGVYGKEITSSNGELTVIAIERGNLAQAKHMHRVEVRQD